MRILVDSADLAAIHEALSSGIVAGVTTNPTLLRRAGVAASRVPELARAAIAAGAGEVHLQTGADDADAMIAEGRELVRIDPERIRVKLVATPAGYQAAAVLSAEGTGVTLTGVYTLQQALAAQSAGARSIAFYLGRVRDAGIEPLQLVGRMQELLRAQAADVEILAASVREPDELAELALLGVASATLAPAVLARLLQSDATDAAAATFREDARAIQAI